MEVRELTFAYPEGEDVLHEISLQIDSGEFVLLCGPSGCGKSTLLRCMKKEIAPVGRCSGSITQLPASEIGYVFQNPDNQIVTDTVRHELAFGLENMGLSTNTIRRRVAETALFFGIDEWVDASVHEISGGQKQLLNLASVIAMRPKVLLLDEPVSQLDPSARKNFLDLLVRVNRELGIAVFLSEHHMEELLPLADGICYMKDGKFAYQGDVEGYIHYIKEQEASCMDMLPAATRIACALEPELVHFPLTVRDGRAYLERMPDVKERLYKAEESVGQKKCEQAGPLCLLVDHIWFQYDKHQPYVLRNLALPIHKGEFHAILGGNGSGKTTLLSILGRRLFATRGKIRVEGHKKIPGIALLTQNPKAMFSRDLVRDELSDAGCSQELVQELELSELLDRHPYDLSGGEQQRLGLAMVLAGESELLLLDEPSKGMDICRKKSLGEYLRAYVQKGNTVLCVTHDVEFAAAYADVCSLLFEGEVLSTEPTDTFMKDNAFYTTDMIRVMRGFI